MFYIDSPKPEVLIFTFDFHTENKSWRVLKEYESNAKATLCLKLLVQLHDSINISVISTKSLDNSNKIYSCSIIKTLILTKKTTKKTSNLEQENHIGSIVTISIHIRYPTSQKRTGNYPYFKKITSKTNHITYGCWQLKSPSKWKRRGRKLIIRNWFQQSVGMQELQDSWYNPHSES